MNKSIVFWILLILSIILFIFAFICFMLKGPSNNICQNMPGLWQKPNCVNVMEKKMDLSIPKPKQKIYIGQFSYDPNLAGGPVCFPMYYAFRYVRISDGSFGPLSDWTTIPVYAGAKTLPCIDTKCSNVPLGKDSCNFNRPVMVTIDPLDLAMVDGYVLNLHRQSGGFDPSDEGEIVGILLAASRDQPNGSGWTSSWVDVIFNTNQRGQICKGC